MKVYLFTLIISLCISACIKKPYYYEIEGYTQGTKFKVVYRLNKKIIYPKVIDSLLNCYDNVFSMYKPNTIINKINDNDTCLILNHHFIKVFNTSREIFKKTNGAFDITIAPVINALGFGPEGLVIFDTTVIDSLMQFVGMAKIKIADGKIVKEHPGIKINMNAIAQGYAVDYVCAFLDSLKIKNYLVDIGGEVRTKGVNNLGNKWRIGIDIPDESNQQSSEDNLYARIELSDKAIATSGNYRKFHEINGVKYVHTINPKTGYPARSNLLSATVVAYECIIADAYATAFMVMGLDKCKTFLSQNKELDAYLIYSDKNGELCHYITDGISDKIME